MMLISKTYDAKGVILVDFNDKRDPEANGTIILEPDQFMYFSIPTIETNHPIDNIRLHANSFNIFSFPPSPTIKYNGALFTYDLKSHVAAFRIDKESQYSLSFICERKFCEKHGVGKVHYSYEVKQFNALGDVVK